MPVTGADRGEKLLHVGRVGEQLPVHVPRIPVDQHPAEVERDGLDLLLLAGHAATVPAVIAAIGAEPCSRHWRGAVQPPMGAEPCSRRSAWSRAAAGRRGALQSWL